MSRTNDLSQVVSPVQEHPLAELRCWPENPRTIRPDRLDDLKQALMADRDQLAARPLLALPDGTVIAGNQRLLAARELGWTAIPVITVDLDPARARLWALRDNNAYGEWDQPKLADLLAELNQDDLELTLTGFSGNEIGRLLAGLHADADPDDAPEPPERPDSQPGEIYQLGRHKLACGDACDPQLLQRLIDSDRPELVWTDPPYGVNYTGKTPRAMTIANDHAQQAGPLLQEVLSAATPLLASSARFYIACPAGAQGTDFRGAITAAGWLHRQTLVWIKNSPVLGHSDYHYTHEEILYGHLPGPGRVGRGRHAGTRWYGGNNQTSAFHIDRPSRSETHPTMKPVALIEPMLANSSRRGDTVFDPFAGSGSTLIACERTGRRCLAVELDPGYCDVIRQRYQEQHDGR